MNLKCRLVIQLCLSTISAQMQDNASERSITVCDGNMGSRLLNSPDTETFFNGSVIKGGECVFSKKLVVIGAQGAGKSSIANTFLGWDKSQREDSLPFIVGHGVKAGTLSSSYASGAWLGKLGSPGVTVVDTPGFNNSVQQLEDMVWMLGELEEVNAYVLVFRYKDRMSSELARSLLSVSRLLGNVQSNLAVVISFWSFSPSAEADRDNRRVNRKRYSDQIVNMLQEVLNSRVQFPVFYIDSHYNKYDLNERKVFNKESGKLWEFMMNVGPWVSLPPSKLKAQVRRVRRRTGEIKEKCQVLEEDKEDWKEKVEARQQIIKQQDASIMQLRQLMSKLKNKCLFK